MDGMGIAIPQADKEKADAVVKTLEQKLSIGQLAYVEINLVEDACGCHGRGVSRGHIYSPRLYTYLGVAGSKSGTVLEKDDSGIMLFPKDRFVGLRDVNDWHIISWNLSGKEGFYVPNEYLQKTEVVEFKDLKELRDKSRDLAYFMRGHHDREGLRSIKVFVGDRDVMYDFVVEQKGVFEAVNILERQLKLPTTQKMVDRALEDSKKEIAKLYNLAKVAEGNGNWGNDELGKQLKLVREGTFAKMVGTVEPNKGITIHVREYLEYVEQKVGNTEKGKERSRIRY